MSPQKMKMLQVVEDIFLMFLQNRELQYFQPYGGNCRKGRKRAHTDRQLC